MTTVNEWLDGKQRIADAAAPGPWITEDNEPEDQRSDSTHIASVDGGMFIYDEGGHTMDDARFIADARTTVPRLITALRKAIETIDEIWEGGSPPDHAGILAILEGHS